MLSDEEKQELKEMAQSESLREDFRTLRKNSQAIERCISVDELTRWLTAINRNCPGEPKRKHFVNDNNFRL